MKLLTALLVTIALISPAFAQNTPLNGMQLHRQTPTTAPAFKPIILHTGRPITQNDKMQMYSAATKAYSAKTPGAKVRMNSQIAASYLNPSATITPLQLFKPGFVETYLRGPDTVDMARSYIHFLPGSMAYSGMDFYINVNANTTYLLTFKIIATAKSGLQMQIGASPASGSSLSVGTGLQNVDLTPGENQFVYAFIPSNSGLIDINLLSQNAYWQFESCEITATPMN
jgi:hypothetical protein